LVLSVCRDELALGELNYFLLDPILDLRVYKCLLGSSSLPRFSGMM